MQLLVTLIGLAFVFLLPRGTNVPYSRRPAIALTLIAVNVFVHLVTQSLQLLEGAPLTRLLGGRPGLEAMPAYVDLFALNPAKVLEEGGWRYIQILTANFLHADWLHLLFNLWYFYLFAVNLEDRLGPLRFGVLMAVAMAVSQVAVLSLTQGQSAAMMPHAGFSGVVYATLAAYLVCLPRSKINVVLIYSLTFWLIFFFVGGAVTFFIFLFVGPLAELAWLAFFILAFIYLEPGHISFGIPAFIFLGHRVLFDSLTIEKQMASSVSVWSHAGGFAAGLLVALAFNGFQGLRETFERADDRPPPTPRERERQRALSLAEAAERDEGAARELLGRLVFLANAGAAARLYIDTVMPRHPRLCLDLPAMVTLARMLEAQGERTAALDACSRAIAEHKTETGIEQVYLQAARLCVGLHGHGGEGVQYVDMFLSLAVLNRDKYEARKLRDDLAEQARQEGEESAAPGDAGPPRQPPAPPAPQPDLPDDPWGARRLAPRAQGEMRRRGRMSRIETDGEPAAPGQPALEGRQPLPLKTREDSGSPVDDAADPSETKPLLPLASRGSVLEVSRKAPREDAAPPSLEIRTAAPLPRDPAVTPRTGSAEASGGGALFTPPPISTSPGAAELRHSASGAAVNASLEAPCVLLLTDADETAGRAFGDRLTALVSPAGLTARRVAGHPIAVLRGLAVSRARELADAAAGLALSATPVSGDHPAITMEPLEVTSVTLDDAGVTLRSAANAIRNAYADIAVVHFSGMRLSPSSKSIRLVIEVIALPVARRKQVWARTLVAAQCSISGAAPAPETALPDIARELAQRIAPAALTPMTAEALREGGTTAELPSFEDYEDYVLFHILAKTGRPPE